MKPPIIECAREADVRLLERDSRAVPAAQSGACGKGIRQPGWAACHRKGTWWIARPDTKHYDHAYCSEHAAKRLRAADALTFAACAAQDRVGRSA